MAVLPMKRVSIYALRKNRKQILEALQRRGVIELCDVIPEDSVFKKTDLSATRAVFEKNIVNLQQGLEVLGKYAPEQTSMLSMLNGRQELSVQEYETFYADQDEILRVAYRLNTLAKQITESNAAVLRMEAQREALVPWASFDLPLGFRGTKSTKAFIGTFTGDMTQQEIYEQLAAQLSIASVNLELISRSKEQTCVFLVCPLDHAPALEEALRVMNFARPALTTKTPPATYREKLEADILLAQQAAEAAVQEIKSYSGVRNALRFTTDYFTLRAQRYELIGHLAQSRRTFILTGYIPARETAALEKLLGERFDLALEFEEPDENDEPPILLQNNRFAAPVESVVESYSLPAKGERDPTSVMAIFYYVLFGLMLSDAAYGLIMVAACGLCLWKFKTMEAGMKKTLTMFLLCGISTTFWGFLFGSFFGDAVGVISQTFFHKDWALKPLWFEPVKDPMRMLVFAFLLGVIHLFTGLAMKLIQCVKDHKYLDALYDVIFWYMLVGGAIVYLLTMSLFTNMMGLTFILPPIAGTIATVCAIIGAIGIVLTSGRESKNWIKRLLKGLYGLYNVTGYLSDILSYSRLLALGLATGVIATVFNKMGSMMGGGIAGTILFIVVFVIGHTLNIGINLLGAYVHTNRLQFVEFFGKFYEGGGRKFSPFATNTKYYKIKEDI